MISLSGDWMKGGQHIPNITKARDETGSLQFSFWCRDQLRALIDDTCRVFVITQGSKIYRCVEGRDCRPSTGQPQAIRFGIAILTSYHRRFTAAEFRYRALVHLEPVLSLAFPPFPLPLLFEHRGLPAHQQDTGNSIDLAYQRDICPNSGYSYRLSTFF